MAETASLPTNKYGRHRVQYRPPNCDRIGCVCRKYGLKDMDCCRQTGNVIEEKGLLEHRIEGTA